MITFYLSGLLSNINLYTLLTCGKFANGSFNGVYGEVEGFCTAVITLKCNCYLVFTNIFSAGTVGYGIITEFLRKGNITAY